jgi:hypothetical protein
LFTRTAFTFVAVAHHRQKYPKQPQIVLLFFEALYGLTLVELDRLSDRLWSTIPSARFVPNWPATISSEADWDGKRTAESATPTETKRSASTPESGQNGRQFFTHGIDYLSQSTWAGEGEIHWRAWYADQATGDN